MKLTLIFLFDLADNEAIVRYGVSESELVNKVLAKTNTYKASDMCGPPANTVGFRDPGFIHDALITDLKPSTRYFYSFGSEKVMNQLKVHIHPYK